MVTPERQRRRRIRWWLIPLLMLAALLVYWVIPKPREVRAARVREGRLTLSLITTGIVEGELFDISSRVTARLTQLYAEEGDAVARGQPLARLEDDDLQAEVARAQAGARAAEQDVRALGSAAAAERTQSLAAVERAEANLRTAQQNLRLVRAGARAEDIAGQRAVVEQLRVQAEEARRNYERAETLYQAEAISTQRRDAARAAYDVARAQLAQQETILQKLRAGPREEEIAAAQAQVGAAEAGVREARAGLTLAAARDQEVEGARARLDVARAAYDTAVAQRALTTLRSPETGTVVRKHKNVGEMASAYEPVYTVANLSKLWVTAEVNEEDLAAVVRGQQVTITLDAFPGREIPGTVTEISTIAEPKAVGRVRAKVIRTRVTLDTLDVPLRPGMEVNVAGSVTVPRQTLLVPNDAVLIEGEHAYVFLLREGRARKRRVEVGQSNFEDTQVLSGVRAGELVAVSDVEQLEDGARVRIVE